MHKKEDTLANLIEAGRAAFLKDGFHNTTLRDIAKNAGVTTGAFFRYFESKEKFFDSFVQNEYNEVINYFKETPTGFTTDENGLESIVHAEAGTILWLMNYSCEHKDAFTLLLLCSEGTKYKSFVEELISLETARFEYAIEKAGKGSIKEIMGNLALHLVIGTMIKSAFTPLTQNTPKEESEKCIRNLSAFNLGGFQKVV